MTQTSLGRSWRKLCSVGAFALFAWLALADAATAQTTALGAPLKPLPLCVNDAKLVAKYNNGLTLGQQKADAFFASTDVAKSQQKLKNKLGKALDRLHDQIREAMQADTRDARRCRIQGVADGFIYRLAQLLGQCVLDGAQWGQFTSELYCELSIELGGLGDVTVLNRAPAGLCGTLFEQVCDSVYAYVASEGSAALAPSVSAFIASRGVTIATYPGCAAFTKGAFETVFEGSLELDCTYSQ
jgi:hypothetical protein